MKNQYVLLGLLILLLSGCVDTILLDPAGDPNENVVIHGKLTYGTPSTVFVRVSRFRPVDRYSNASAVGVERVDLIDVESGDTYLVPVSTERRGFYGEISGDDPNIEIRFNRFYQLEVELRSGEVYRSSPQEVYQVPPIDDITYTLSTESRTDPAGNIFQQDFITYQVKTTYDRPDGNGNANLLWSRRSIFELDQDPGGDGGNICFLEMPIVNNSLPRLRGEELAEAPGQSTLFDVHKSATNYRYADGYLFVLFQESVSDEAISYWDQVSRVLNRSGTISEDPVGEVEGNMFSVSESEEVVYGLFYAVDQDSSSIFIRPEEVGNPAHLCPVPVVPLPGGPPPITVCNDCIQAWEEGPVYFTPPPGWGG
jgi:hypothetical protein